MSLDPAGWSETIFAFLELLVRKYGPAGIAVAMFAESAGIPFASSIVIVSAGSLIYGGHISFWIILVASTAGITLGSIFEYSLGYLSSKTGHFIRSTRIGKRALKKQPAPQTKSRIRQFWENYGTFSVFMGQLFGVTRTFISFPAGALKMNIFLFIAYTALGGALFSAGAIGFSLVMTGFLGLLLHSAQNLPPWAWIGALFLLFLAVLSTVRLGWPTRLFHLLKRLYEPRG